MLASTSPRRRELLAGLGLAFDVEAPQVDERPQPGELPAVHVERVARAKAGAAAGPDKVAIGADTMVVWEGQALGKPAHPEEARTMLRHLSGATHEVVTGVAVASWDGGPRLSSAVEATMVRMLPLTEEEIAAYVASGEPLDKAGGYALQGLGALLVEAVHGSPSNVAGLPVHVVARLLRGAGIDLLART